MQGLHNFGPSSPNTFKIALYTASATLNASTTQYQTTGEVVGTGYTAGGNVLVINPSPTSGTNSANITTAFISFNTATWTNASFVCRGALIYNSTQNNTAVAVLDFGSDKTVINDNFQITFPSADANSAIVRIS